MSITAKIYCLLRSNAFFSLSLFLFLGCIIVRSLFRRFIYPLIFSLEVITSHLLIYILRNEIYLYIYLFIYISICQSVCMFVYLSIYPSLHVYLLNMSRVLLLKTSIINSKTFPNSLHLAIPASPSSSNCEKTRSMVGNALDANLSGLPNA